MPYSLSFSKVVLERRNNRDILRLRLLVELRPVRRRVGVGVGVGVGVWWDEGFGSVTC